MTSSPASAPAPVPVIDLANPSPSEVAQLDAACVEHGFFLLRGHGCDELIARTWQQTERFFDAGRATWEPLRRTEQNPMGFNDRELTKGRRDAKAVFDFLDPTTAKADTYNRWPDDLPGFQEAMAEFHAGFAVVATRTLSLLHDVLELDDDLRGTMSIAPTSSPVRLNHYPVGDPVPEDDREGLLDLGETALGYHTDPGTITLLLQDMTGGLQTQARDGSWIDVPPAEGTIVVNLGDAMQVWTNDRWRAAVHRVVPMTTSRRFSIPFFGNPPRETLLEPITELADAPRYRPFAWKDFMASRNRDNYADVGADDAQISDYALS